MTAVQEVLPVKRPKITKEDHLAYQQFLKSVWGEKGPPMRKTTDEELHRIREKVSQEYLKMSPKEFQQRQKETFKKFGFLK